MMFMIHKLTHPIQQKSTKGILQLMVRGLFTNLCYPFAYFASTGFTSAQLYPCTMESTQVLESLESLFQALVSDGASPNRNFFNIVSEGVDWFYFKQNPLDRRRRMYLISDVPHLNLKSHAGSRTQGICMYILVFF